MSESASNPSDQTIQYSGDASRPGSGVTEAIIRERTGDLSVSELTALVCADQRKRWQRGERVSAEDILAYAPTVRQHPPSAVEVVLNEAQLREESGQAPEIEELVRRFPELEALMRRQFDLRSRMTSADPPLPENRTVEVRTLGLSRDDARPSVTGYEILKELGRGGMGVVYKARQISLSRIVALKMVLGGAHASTADLTRFKIEAEAVASLQHPNIVQLYEVGEQNRLPYFALEFVDGGSLANWIDSRREPMAAGAAARMTETLARAMHAAHQRGIIHRDLKPDNVLLTVEGTPKITDFGLAKRLGSDQGQTQSGSVMGTPNYMAPEQASGNTRAVGLLADVYALGAMLYELLTRRPPFDAESPLDTLRLVVEREPVPPTRFNAKVPRDLETICLKCLEKDPQRRYQSAAALADDLQRFLSNEPIVARPVGLLERAAKWTRRHPAWAALLVVLLAVLAAGVAGAGFYHKEIAAERSQAIAAQHTAEQAQKTAEQAQQTAEESVNRLTVSNGLQLLDDGDLLGALPWFARAFQLDADQKRLTAQREEMHRVRLGALLRLSPRLQEMWFHEGRVTWATYSPDGKLVLTTCARGYARLFDAETGEERPRHMKHKGVVQYGAFSRDGSRIVTASADGTARVWDLSEDRPLTPELKHKGAVFQADFSPDGQLVVTASADHTARVWDIASGEVVTTLNHDDAVRHAVFSPSGNYVVTASLDDTARVWDAADNFKLRLTLHHGDDVLYAAFNPDSTRIVTTSSDDTAKVWDLQGKGLLTLNHTAPVLHAAFNSRGTQLVTASEDTRAQAWDATTGVRLGAPMKHGSNVYCAAYSPDDHFIATASDDNTARVWNALTGEPVSPPLRHSATLYRAMFRPKTAEPQLLTASADGTARVWVKGTRATLGPQMRHESAVTMATYSPSGHWVLTATKKGTAHLWDVNSGERQLKEESPALVHKKTIYAAVFSPDGKWIATASADSTARVWDATTHAPVGPGLQHSGEVRNVAFSVASSFVATSSADQTAAVWEVSSGRQAAVFKGHSGVVNQAVFSPEGRRLLTASADHTARIWSVADPAAPPLVLRHDEEIFSAYFDREGRRVVTASADCTARVWDAATGAPVGKPLHHSSKVYSAIFDPVGQRVLTVSDDSTARVWDAATGEPLTPLLRHGGMVFRGTFGPRNYRVATASEDNTARVWDSVTGEALTPPLPHRVGVVAVAFAPNGDDIVTASSDHTARIWRLPPDRTPLDEMVLDAKLLSGGWFDREGNFVPLGRNELKALWQNGKESHRRKGQEKQR